MTHHYMTQSFIGLFFGRGEEHPSAFHLLLCLVQLLHNLEEALEHRVSAPRRRRRRRRWRRDIAAHDEAAVRHAPSHGRAHAAPFVDGRPRARDALESLEGPRDRVAPGGVVRGDEVVRRERGLAGRELDLENGDAAPFGTRNGRVAHTAVEELRAHLVVDRLVGALVRRCVGIRRGGAGDGEEGARRVEETQLRELERLAALADRPHHEPHERHRRRRLRRRRRRLRRWRRRRLRLRRRRRRRARRVGRRWRIGRWHCRGIKDKRKGFSDSVIATRVEHDTVQTDAVFAVPVRAADTVAPCVGDAEGILARNANGVFTRFGAPARENRAVRRLEVPRRLLWIVVRGDGEREGAARSRRIRRRRWWWRRRRRR
mmetsp:Transcript_1831/g.6725  ORF Transcript_1831/g.6725 Transcript_1831/m.6725 type:complete len:373 (+) Transcript_1831:1928-3046(+)